MNVYCDKRKEVTMKLSEAVGKRVGNSTFNIKDLISKYISSS